MLRLGLTGGIGAGKSTVARRLADHGAVVIDADRLAREVVEPASAGLAAVVGAFGPGVVAADGSLDRAALGAIVFADPQARLRLNGILHPRIAELTAQRLAGLPPEAIAVHDVPLLVENRMGASYHLVLVVHCPAEQRVRRLVTDRGMSEDDARARVSAQADDVARRAAADVWLDNSGEVQDVLAHVDRLWAERVTPFAANLLARRAAPRPDRVRLVSPEPDWADAGRRLGARVRRAAGPWALRVDHVGSTSVPDLVAKDVIDLQLVVADRSTADAVRGGLESAGFIRSAGRGWDELPDGGRAAEFVHTAADPGRAVNLHVRSVTSPAWRHALALRDWLRDHADERDTYAAVKTAAATAAEGAGIEAYQAAKESWIGAALARAEAWASDGGWAPDEPEG